MQQTTHTGPMPGEDDLDALPEIRLPVSVGEAEKRAIFDALEFTGGDRLRAAQMLGIGRTTLYRKLKQYKIGTP